MEIVMEKGEKCLVIGSGISGIGSTSLLEKMGAEVVLYDSNEKLTAEEIREKLPEGSKARCITGELPEEVEKEIQRVVLSPGVPVDAPLVEKLKADGAAIMGEIELGYQMEKGRVAAITGTNGKTTTTTLVGEIMKAHLGEDRVFVVGNIGNPYTSECLKTTPDTVTVGEISSFQLETIRDFHPEYYAGPFKQASYHGSLCGGKGKYHIKSDRAGYLCFKLRERIYQRFRRKMSGEGSLLFLCPSSGEWLFPERG